MEQRQKLRFGYTTGACAQAAAKAAAVTWFTGVEAKEVKIHLPGGSDAVFAVQEVKKRTDRTGAEASVCCGIKKDSGDDPDVTDGVIVYAEVRARKDGVFSVDGGAGIGRVTKPGLDQPVGAAAINRVPRRMIEQTLEEVCDLYDWPYGMEAVISIPGGEALARKTFNPRLGIEGGLSVLGTTGIVEPMSEKALVDTIRVEINVKRAAGQEYLLAAPGNYGMDFLKERYGIGREEAVKCSNFIGDTIDMALESGAKGLLLVGHIGKLIKVAGGIMNTHSRYADGRMEIAAAAMLRAGLDGKKAAAMLSCVTMEDALALLNREERERWMQAVLERLQMYLDIRGQKELLCGAVVFSGTYGCLGMTKSAQTLLKKLQIAAADSQ